MEELTPIILVALLTLVGNITYFEYKFKKESEKSVLRKRLTDLLMPLYFVFKRDEIAYIEWSRNDALDPHDFFSDMPKRIIDDIYKISEKNIYLADDELYEGYLKFLDWGFGADCAERFQRIHDGNLQEDIAFEEFREMVYKKFHTTRQDYLTG